jgi:Cu/Ag efflux pump CusA
LRDAVSAIPGARVKLDDAVCADLDLLKRLPVPGARGPVPLGNGADVAIESGPASISRYDRLRNVNNVNFEIEPRAVSYPVATKNSILLVDYMVLAMRDHGSGRCVHALSHGTVNE